MHMKTETREGFQAQEFVIGQGGPQTGDAT